jgi:DNA-binding XRE family transcriptional regulator
MWKEVVQMNDEIITALAPGRPWREYLDKQLLDPAFRAEYEALDDEYTLIRQLIDLRIQRGLSQRQLAERAGMKQPSIARLESGRTANLLTLRRIADALDADVRISIEPRPGVPI